MVELSDSVREKLNDPEIIRGMAEQILIDLGKSSFYYSFDRGLDFFGFDYFLAILPEGKLRLKGEMDFRRMNDFNKNINRFFIDEKLEKYYPDFVLSQNQKLISYFFDEYAKIENLSRILIYDGELDLVNKKCPLVFEYKDKLLTFEKGEWQKDLAEIYLSSLKWSQNKQNILK